MKIIIKCMVCILLLLSAPLMTAIAQEPIATNTQK